MSLRERIQRRLDFLIGLCIALLGALIYLPYLGSFPLWDPWEPHYSQVAWEMQSRDTWWEPYYRNANNWWSKPILMLWLLRSSFGLLWDANNSFFEHELCARLPFALLAIAGGIAHYDWVRRLFGRTVGIVAAIVLLSSAQYLLIGRQVMVDMAMVVTYGTAMGYLAVGLLTHDNAQKQQSRVKGRCVAFLRCNWPYVAFWSLQALAVLAKGFVPTALTVLVLCSFGVLTLPSSSNANHAERRHSANNAWKRGTAALLLSCVVVVVLRFALRHGTWSKEQRELAVAFAAVTTLLVIVLGMFGNWAPSRHARGLLRRIGAHWGLPLFLGIAGPWYAFMSLRHGWQYWYNFIYFHHLGRAAGAIHLPTGTFDFYLRHLGFALFPWTGFLVAGLVVFLGRCHPTRGMTEQRNAYVLCLIVVPMAFFMVTGTKFAHYIFPVVPACTVIVAASLVWLTRQAKETDSESPLGNAATATTETGGTVALFGLLSLLAFLVLFNDIRHDVRCLLRLVVYYFNRATPFEYQPARAFGLLGLPVAAVSGLLLIWHRVTRWHLIALAASSTAFACYLGWVTMPAMDATYTYRPAYDAYRGCAKPGEPIGQYIDAQQPERSVTFLSRNQVVHLKTDSAASVYLSGRGRRFVIVDRKRLANLRRLAERLGIVLHVVFDDHPYARLVSTEPSPTTSSKRSPHILGELPSQVKATDIDFDSKIRLLGWKVTPETVLPGQTVNVAFYFEAVKPIDRNWKLLVHADIPTAGGDRMILDHFPAGGSLPTSGWQEGRIVEDLFELQVPVDYRFDSFFIWTGFFLDGARMPLANSPPHDRHGRVRGPLVLVQQSAAH